MAEYELTIEKVVDATPARLFRTWTGAELIKQWCVQAYETTESKVDLRPGGRFFTRMKGPDLAEVARGLA